nr:hypothetical protein [Paramuribaculum intestinale]
MLATIRPVPSKGKKPAIEYSAVENAGKTAAIIPARANIILFIRLKVRKVGVDDA